MLSKSLGGLGACLQTKCTTILLAHFMKLTTTVATTTDNNYWTALPLPSPSAPPIATTYVTDAYYFNCSSYVASTTVYYPKGAIILLENDQINFHCLSSTSLLNKGVFQNTCIINKTSTSILNCDCLSSVFM